MVDHLPRRWAFFGGFPIAIRVRVEGSFQGVKAWGCFGAAYGQPRAFKQCEVGRYQARVPKTGGMSSKTKDFRIYK